MADVEDVEASRGLPSSKPRQVLSCSVTPLQLGETATKQQWMALGVVSSFTRRTTRRSLPSGAPSFQLSHNTHACTGGLLTCACVCALLLRVAFGGYAAAATAAAKANAGDDPAHAATFITFRLPGGWPLFGGAGLHPGSKSYFALARQVEQQRAWRLERLEREMDSRPAWQAAAAAAKEAAGFRPAFAVAALHMAAEAGGRWSGGGKSERAGGVTGDGDVAEEEAIWHVELPDEQGTGEHTVIEGQGEGAWGVGTVALPQGGVEPALYP